MVSSSLSLSLSLFTLSVLSLSLSFPHPPFHHLLPVSVVFSISSSSFTSHISLAQPNPPFSHYCFFPALSIINPSTISCPFWRGLHLLITTRAFPLSLSLSPRSTFFSSLLSSSELCLSFHPFLSTSTSPSLSPPCCLILPLAVLVSY